MPRWAVAEFWLGCLLGAVVWSLAYCHGFCLGYKAARRMINPQSPSPRIIRDNMS